MGSKIKEIIRNWVAKHFVIYSRVQNAFNQLCGLESRTLEMNQQLQNVNSQVTRLLSRVENIETTAQTVMQKIETVFSDPWIMQFKKLKQLMSEIEYYQPLYRLGQIIVGTSENPKRPCLDRAEVIFQACGNNVQGARMLDVGASFGFFSFYFSDRGAAVTGLENHEKSIYVAETTKIINQLSPTFIQGTFDAEFVKQIPENRYEYGLFLSVLHHVVHRFGLEYTQKLLSELMQKIPVLFVELALKTETIDAPWVKSLPEDPLALFKECRDVRVEYLGEFPTHLSNIKRPLYKIIRGGTLQVNTHVYNIETFKLRAYETSPIGATRKYFVSAQAFVKEYLFLDNNGPDHCNRDQIIREISNNQALLTNHASSLFFPKLIEYEVTSKKAVLVFQKVLGVLIADKLESLTDTEKIKIFHTVLLAQAELRSIGLYHNDLRCWNIMLLDTGDVRVIDLGSASGVELEPLCSSLLWLAAEMEQKKILNHEHPRLGVPFLKAAEYGAWFKDVAEYLLAHEKNLVLDDLIAFFRKE